MGGSAAGVGQMVLWQRAREGLGVGRSRNGNTSHTPALRWSFRAALVLELLTPVNTECGGMLADVFVWMCMQPSLCQLHCLPREYQTSFKVKILTFQGFNGQGPRSLRGLLLP